MANKTYLVIELPIRNDKATELLNGYAAEGWRVTAVVASFLTTTQVISQKRCITPVTSTTKKQAICRRRPRRRAGDQAAVALPVLRAPQDRHGDEFVRSGAVVDVRLRD
jgi:hypothetical protein